MPGLKRLLSFVLCLCISHTNEIIGSEFREGDPASYVEGVSLIYRYFTQTEVDLVVAGPDPLILNRYYSSRDDLQNTNFGGWRIFPQCYLTVQKDLEGGDATSEGKVQYYTCLLGMAEGSVVKYAANVNLSDPKARTIFALDLDVNGLGVSNTARGLISAQTNIKNNQLIFISEDNQFELLTSLGGKRIYVQHPKLEVYLLQFEILPSGNKIFYEYDDFARVKLVEMKNAAELKKISWLKIEYNEAVTVKASDTKTVEYHFQTDPSGYLLLKDVIRPESPNLVYQYRVVDSRALLEKKMMPNDRYLNVTYTDEPVHSVELLTIPARADEVDTIRFRYMPGIDGSGATEVFGPLDRKTVVRYDSRLQLTDIEQFHKGALYRIEKKIWGEGEDRTNLVATSVEDGKGQIFFYKTFEYDRSGNICKETEYGNLTGGSPEPITFNSTGVPDEKHESHTKRYLYKTGGEFDIVDQTDGKGNGIEQRFIKGTKLPLSKFIINNNKIKKRYFYKYNEDGALDVVIEDDGDEFELDSAWEFYERHITYLNPKQESPALGMPEIVEEKYLDIKTEKEILLKRIVNYFNPAGFVTQQDLCDSNGDLRYSIKFEYTKGRLTYKTDPLGNEVRYTYDDNFNLRTEDRSEDHSSFFYSYDLKNRLIETLQKDRKGSFFATSTEYCGNVVKETDRYGHQTVSEFDDLGRLISVTYPEIFDENLHSTRPTYVYTYDLFDNQITSKDLNGNKIHKNYTVRGQPTLIHRPDGSKEMWKYDLEGTLHRYCARNGIVTVFEYDYLGRIEQMGRYTHEKKEIGGSRFKYDSFHLIFEENEAGDATTYRYDCSGRIFKMIKSYREAEFDYDSMGRNHAIRRKKSRDSFSLEVKEYDLLGRMIEERTENSQGSVLLKNRYVYESGHLSQVIGYPQNIESILSKYDYDDFGRLCKITDAFNQETKITYENDYLNEMGQKVLKQNLIDPLGNQTEEIFNSENKISKRIRKDKKGTLLAQSEYFYDLSGQILFERDAKEISEGEIANKFEVKWSYDSGYHPKSIQLAVGSVAERATKFHYNSYAQMDYKYIPGSKKITYEYNEKGDINCILFGSNHYDLSHDGKGNIYYLKFNPSNEVGRFFDAHNKIKSESYSNGSIRCEVAFVMDQEGSIEQIKLPDGSSIVYGYDGQFVKTISRHKLNKNKPFYTHQINSRDLMGHPIQETLALNAGKRTQTWNKIGRKFGISTNFFQESISSFDLQQNTKKIETKIGNEKIDTIYSYNDLYELIAESGNIPHSYSYDSLNNRVEKDHSENVINELNQITKAENVIYTYDLAGNLTSRKDQEAKTFFEWDELGRLTLIRTPEQTEITYTYDLNGKRLSKKIKPKGKDPEVYIYFYLGQTELGCIDKNKKIVELKVPSNPNSPQSPSIAIEILKNIYVPIYDLQGNIACLVDAESGELAESYRYSAYGEEKIFDGQGNELTVSTIKNPWRYRGKRVDQESGLVYFGQRYYDPVIGRWISPDPAGFIDGPNLYSYVHNNPVNYVDYYGLASQSNDSDEFKKYFYGEYESHCLCETHRTCKKGGDIGSAISNSVGGASLGVVSTSMSFGGFFAEVGFGLSLPARFFVSDWSEIKDAHASMHNDLSQLHAMWNEGMEYAIGFDQHSWQAKLWESGTYYGLFALTVAESAVNWASSKAFTTGVNWVAWDSEAAAASKGFLSNNLVECENVIHITPQGVAIPSGLKYNIPSHYVENIHRPGSYGIIVNGKFVEKLRIDPATPSNMKGPNYSHYHINGKGTHNSPRTGDIDPGFDR